MQVAPAVVTPMIVPVSTSASGHAAATLGPDASSALGQPVARAAPQTQLELWEAYIQQAFSIDVQRMFVQSSSFLDIIHEAFFRSSPDRHQGCANISLQHVRLSGRG